MGNLADLAEWANQMSEVLFGFREATEKAMLDRARYLAELEKDHDVGKAAQGKKIRELVEQLSEAVEYPEEEE